MEFTKDNVLMHICLFLNLKNKFAKCGGATIVPSSDPDTLSCLDTLSTEDIVINYYYKLNDLSISEATELTEWLYDDYIPNTIELMDAMGYIKIEDLGGLSSLNGKTFYGILQFKRA